MKLIRIVLKPILAVFRLLWRIIRAPFDLARRAYLRRSDRRKKRKERYSPYLAITNLNELGIIPDYVKIAFTEQEGITWEVSKGDKKAKITKKEKADQ